MVRYNIEVKYLCFGKEHTSEVYYNALDNLNEEEKESVLQGYLDIVKTYKGFEGFLESHIWKDKEEKKVINLNKSLKINKEIEFIIEHFIGRNFEIEEPIFTDIVLNIYEKIV